MRNDPRAFISVFLVCAFIFGALVLGVHKARKAHEQQSAPAGTIAAQQSDQKTEPVHPGLGRTQQQEVEKADVAHLGSSPASGALPQAPSAAAASLPSVAPSVAVASAPQPTCFYESFHHKPTSGHTDEEACSRHKNLLKLTHANPSAAHFCVRVNGTPVKFMRKGDEILIGSIAGPKAKITVNYCLGKSNCDELAKDDCTVPKDEFMEALGGDTDSLNAQWGDNGQLNADVKKELEEIDGATSDEQDRAPAQASIFKEWIRDQDASACAQKQPS